mgnify:CR=1 FL=1
MLLCTFLFTVSCEEAEESPYPDIVFEARSSLPIGGRSTAVAFVINEKAYVSLGRYTNSQPLNDCWEYNPETDSWVKKTDFPGIGRVNAIAEVINGKAYVGLGFDPTKEAYKDSSILNDFWCYNPINNSWQKKADFPKKSDGTTPSVNSCFSFAIDSCVYVGANFNGFKFDTQFWKYDTRNDSWTQISDLPSRSTGAVSCTDGERYFSGTGYQTVNDNCWWEYFPASDTWLKRKEMPDNGRLNAVSLSIHNRFFVATGIHFGGTLTGGHLKSDIMEYDALKDVWYKRGNLPGKRENAISFIIGDKAYIGFGENETTIYNDLWCFKP